MSKVHWLALSAVSGIGGVTARKLAERFGGIEEVFDAPDDDLLRVPRITPEIVAGLRRISVEQVEMELLALEDEGVSIVTLDDDDYPANLREASDAPVLLYVFGRLEPEDSEAVAIVGTREPCGEKAEYAEQLARELAARGLVVVSGLASGIDTAAHRGALQAEGGRTLAVLGSGLRCIHPRENVPLAKEIGSHGALLTEFRPDTPAKGPNLMARDRVISGLSKAVIVIEAGRNSGSMDTASKAYRQDRLVLAIPGSPGTRELISQGAEPLDPGSVDLDILADRIRGYARKAEPQLDLWN